MTGKGYCLPAPIELLDEDKINTALKQQGVAVIPVIDSTNQYLLERMNTLQTGDACVAEYQQAGRGRRGRQWFRPLALIFIFPCTGASIRDPLRQWDSAR